MRALTAVPVTINGQPVVTGSSAIVADEYLSSRDAPGTVQAFDDSVDLLQHVIWQYTGDPIERLITLKQRWYDRKYTQFWADWLTNVFDLRTANVFGLYVWSIILDMPMTIEDTSTKTANNWGFGHGHLNFGNGNFGGISTTTVTVTEEEARTLLRLRYFQLVTNGAVTGINAFLKYLWGDSGTVYVIDSLDMTCMYVFTFEPGSHLVTAMKYFDVLPRPAGVKLRKIVTPSNRIFAFDTLNDLYGGYDGSVWSN